MVEITEKMLYRYGELQRQIDECKRNIREMTDEKFSCLDNLLRPPAMTGESQRMKQNSDPVYKAVQRMGDIYDVRIAGAVETLEALYSEFDGLQRWINRAELNGSEKEYIKLRYVARSTVADIAERIGYSERQTQRLRKRLLRLLGAAGGAQGSCG